MASLSEVSEMDSPAEVCPPWPVVQDTIDAAMTMTKQEAVNLVKILINKCIYGYNM